MHDIREVYEIAIRLKRPDLIPDSFSESILAHIRNEQQNALIRLSQADLKNDWAAMEKYASEAIAEFPTYYHFYWYQAAARYHTDRKQEAIEPLKVYVKYSKDEKEYPTAVQWLKEIEAAKPE